MSIEKTVIINAKRFYYYAGLNNFDLGISIARCNFHIGLGFFSVGVEW